MHSLSADNRHIGRYIVQSADYRIYADYLQYRIGRISVSANFPNLDIVCTLPAYVALFNFIRLHCVSLIESPAWNMRSDELIGFWSFCYTCKSMTEQ